MGLNEKIARILKIPKENRDDVDNLTKEVVADIENGQTTGDRLLDFVIYTNGMIHPALTIPYRKLEQGANANIGKQVLALREKNSPRFTHDFYDTLFPERKEIGLLKAGIDIDLKGKNLILPTENYAETTGEHNNKWKLMKGPIRIYWFDMFNLEQGELLKGTEIYKMIQQYHLLDPKRNLKILFGEDVESHFRTNSFGLKHLDTSYVVALDLLGLQSPKDFKDKYAREILDSKISVISEIERLCEEEQKYDQRINEVKGQVGKTPFIENKTDAFFMTFGEKEKLNDTRCEIRRHLHKSLELKMHMQEWKLPWKQPGMTIDVQEYIQGLCEKYKVDYKPGLAEPQTAGIGRAINNNI